MLPLDRQALRAAQARQERFTFLPFYGHAPSADGRLTTSCFSQWFASPFDVDAVSYATAEHWMMASKARVFGDREIEQQILAAPSPAEAKRLGRAVRRFDADTWSRVSFDLVVQGNIAKFSSTPALRAFLLATAPAILVEAAPRDTIWGIGLGVNNPLVHDSARWRGLNKLGFALVKARETLAFDFAATNR